MIKPVNKHVLIELVKHETFIMDDAQKYEEIGTVIDFDESEGFLENLEDWELKKGYKVYFDGWLAAKFPNPKDPENPYWLVKWEDIRAIEPQDETIPE